MLRSEGPSVALEEVEPAHDQVLPGAAMLELRALSAALGWPLGRGGSLLLVRYRPEVRAVARVDLGAGRRPFFVKLLTRRAFRRALARIEQLPVGATALRLQLPLQWSEENCALVFATAPGAGLHGMLRAGRVPDVDLVDRAMRALAALPSTGLPHRTVEDERYSALKMIHRGMTFTPELGELHARVQRATLPRWDEAGLLHADLHDKQIFVTADELHLIDLEGMSAGDPRLDRVNLLEHLRLRSLQWSRCPADAQLAAPLGRRWGLAPDDPDSAVIRGLVRARLAGVYGLRPLHTAIARRLAAEAMTLLRGER